MPSSADRALLSRALRSAATLYSNPASNTVLSTVPKVSTLAYQEKIRDLDLGLVKKLISTVIIIQKQIMQKCTS